MKQLLLLFTLAIISNLSFSQDLEPIELVKKVFTDKEFAKNSDQYSIGEYSGRPNINDLQQGSTLQFKLLSQTESTAVVNMTVFNSLGEGFDTYLHLEKDNTWKIEAFRALAMTGILEEVKLEFESLSENEIDSLVQADDMFQTKQDFYRDLNNINLTLALDDEIIEHFNKNKAQFEKIKEELQLLPKQDHSMKNIEFSDQLKTDYRDLLVTSISTSFSCDNCYEFTIGGMLDNIVGYFYIPNKKDIPEMNPSRLIMIREIGDGWFLFKTT